ncbi:MAG: hypothetical protein WCX82_04855 [archaeon]|jgi:hypothetical protein
MTQTTTQPKQIDASKYRDKDGNLIGTQNNVNEAFGSVSFNLGIGISSFYAKKFVDINTIKDKINTYLAVRYCYDKYTSEMDNNLDNLIQQIPDFAKYIEYKPITQTN